MSCQSDFPLCAISFIRLASKQKKSEILIVTRSFHDVFKSKAQFRYLSERQGRQSTSFRLYTYTFGKGFSGRVSLTRFIHQNGAENWPFLIFFRSQKSADFCSRVNTLLWGFGWPRQQRETEGNYAKISLKWVWWGSHRNG